MADGDTLVNPCSAQRIASDTSRQSDDDVPLNVFMTKQLAAIQKNLAEGHQRIMEMIARHSNRESMKRQEVEEEKRALACEIQRLRRVVAALSHDNDDAVAAICPPPQDDLLDRWGCSVDSVVRKPSHVLRVTTVSDFESVRPASVSTHASSAVPVTSLALHPPFPRVTWGAPLMRGLQTTMAMPHTGRGRALRQIGRSSEILDNCVRAHLATTREAAPVSSRKVTLARHTSTIGKYLNHPVAARVFRVSSMILDSKFFGLFCSMVILANAAALGLQTNSEVKNEFCRVRGEEVGTIEWSLVDVSFSSFFFLEICMRVLATRSDFFFGREKWWNLFDACVVTTSIAEAIMALCEIRTIGGLSILRTLRVLRIIRLLRVAKVFASCRAIASTLQTIIHSLASSAACFVSALCMLLLFLFMFAVTFMQGINAYLSSASDAELESPDFLTKLEDMERFYGTMEDSIWTLFAAVTGGIDWAEVSKPIGYLGSFYKYVFLLYLLFVLFALMNILTGIFVHVAIDSCKMNREIAIEAAIANKEMLIKEIVQLFHEADKDCSGTLSWQEFHDYMQDEKIKAFFMALELDMSSAGRVFDIIDVMRDGELDICEFVQGCIDLRGSAKKVDISIVEKDCRCMLAGLETVLARTEELIHLS